jgi:hypothetical protein
MEVTIPSSFATTAAIRFGRSSSLTRILLPSLLRADNLGLEDLDTLASIDLSSLATISDGLNFYDLDVLSKLQLPSLTFVGGFIHIRYCSQLTYVGLPSLQMAYGFHLCAISKLTIDPSFLSAKGTLCNIRTVGCDDDDINVACSSLDP